ncbi:hypothetical protein ABE288_26485 [Bacillus salipaludis]|uniref:hypothetical protein n=1 Tax=Bacillus salipaludis TaxID=2547811 RepID=UPI003D1C7E58
MKNTKWPIFLMFILPWLTIPLLGNKAMKRYLPSGLLMCLYLIFEGRLAEKRKWWWFPLNIKPNVLGEMPLIFGPFLVGTLWILKYTFGKFPLYVLINIIIDAAFTYLGLNLFKKIGYVSLVRLSKFQLSLVFLIKTFVLYGFQMVYEKLFRKSLYYR